MQKNKSIKTITTQTEIGFQEKVKQYKKQFKLQKIITLLLFLVGMIKWGEKGLPWILTCIFRCLSFDFLDCNFQCIILNYGFEIFFLFF
jgi:hypothetical protein